MHAVTYHSLVFIMPSATTTAFPTIVERWRARAVSRGEVGVEVGVDVDLGVVVCGGDGIAVLTE